MISLKPSGAFKKRQKISVGGSNTSSFDDEGIEDVAIAMEPVRAIECGQVEAVNIVPEQKPLIIPLLHDGPIKKETVGKVRAKNSFVSSAKKMYALSSRIPFQISHFNIFSVDPEHDLDKQAELELLNHSKNEQQTDGQTSNLIIANSADEESWNDGKRKPLLAKAIKTANESDTDKFKRDLLTQASDVDFKSDVYAAVPVDQFGAALLRGMGWAGEGSASSSGAQQERIVPREHRLGLGAAAAPSALQRRGRGGGGRCSSFTLYPPLFIFVYVLLDRDQERDRLWQQRALAAKEKEKEKEREEERERERKVASSSWLRDGAIAWWHGKEEPAREAVRVVQSKGVPGLDKIRQ